MNRHHVTHPDGTTSKRVSQNRIYTHAVQETAQLADGRIVYGVYTWCGSEALGIKALNRERNQMLGREVRRRGNGEIGWHDGKVIAVDLVPAVRS